MYGPFCQLIGHSEMRDETVIINKGFSSSMIDKLGISCEIALSIPKDPTDAYSTLFRVMTVCYQANVEPDLYRHIASLGHYDWTSLKSFYLTDTS